MSFKDNIFQNLPIGEEFASNNVRVTLIGEVAGYFECVKSIKSYTKTEIHLVLKKGGIVIKGEELYIKKYCEGDIVVCGKIACLERE